VYLATDLKTDNEVVVKEYMPVKLARRESDFSVHARDFSTEKLYKLGRKLFFQEASILAAIDHPNIVKVLDFEQSNNTIYSILSYERGMSLHSYLRRLKKPMSEKRLKAIFIALLDALSLVHAQGLLHLDIKPGNIYLRDKKGPLLLDFGAVHKILQSAPQRLFPVVTHGFSPPEQSIKNATMGPASDLYAIGASMRACIEGHPPISAKDRRKGEELKPCAELYAGRYSELLLHIIDWCMEMDYNDRPRSAQEVLKLLRLETSLVSEAV